MKNNKESNDTLRRSHGHRAKRAVLRMATPKVLCATFIFPADAALSGVSDCGRWYAERLNPHRLHRIVKQHRANGVNCR